MNTRIAGMILAVVCAHGVAMAQEEGRRVALIIGNNAYPASPLQNAINDARVIDKALQGAGFKTLLLENAKKADMDRMVGEFLDMLGPDDTALFFYAGHGVQIDNENFLVPVDFEPGNSIAAAKFSCISLAQIYDELARKRAKRRIIILDACRSNPVSKKYSLEAGLARPQRDDLKETYIAYSTGPGQVAADNPDGRNSWFSEALSGLVTQPGLSLDEVFNRVKRQVADGTAGRQTPWVSSTLTGTFYFHRPLNADSENIVTLSAKRMQEEKLREQSEDWDLAIELLNQVVAGKPGNAVEEEAKSRLAYLKARKDAQARFDAGDFAGAAGLFARAVKLDPFAVNAGFEGAKSYLLADQLPQAVALLHDVRVRGTSEAIVKTGAMLKELAPVLPEAKSELDAGIPAPPPIEEVFRATRFGIPDWEAGSRRMQAPNLDVARWSKAVLDSAPQPEPAAAPAPAPTAVAAVPMDPISQAFFHVEVSSSSDTRNLVIRKVGNLPMNSSGVQRPSGVPVRVTTDPPGADLVIEGDADQRCQSPCAMSAAPGSRRVRATMPGYRPESGEVTAAAGGSDLRIALKQEMGFVQLEGIAADTPVLLNGKRVNAVAEGKLSLPSGSYEIVVMNEGQVVSRNNVKVTDLGTVAVQVKR